MNRSTKGSALRGLCATFLLGILAWFALAAAARPALAFPKAVVRAQKGPYIEYRRYDSAARKPLPGRLHSKAEAPPPRKLVPTLSDVARLSKDFVRKTFCDDCEAGTIICETPMTGELAEGDCRLADDTFADVWRLELEEDKETQVNITLSSSSFDTFLFVTSASCESGVLSENDDCGAVTDSCLSLILERGTYYIFANSYAPAIGSYELGVSCSEPPPSLCESCLAGEVLCDTPALGELQPSDCDLGDGSFVQAWELELETNSRVSINLSSEVFDTYLIVEDATCRPPGAVVVNDDCVGSNSCFTGLLPAGMYFVMVNSYDAGATGPYRLEVSCEPCETPEMTESPVPENEADSVPLEVTLSWGGEVPAEVRRPKTIYGTDDRVEEYEMVDEATLRVGDATVALVPRGELTDNGDGTYSLSELTFAEYYQSALGRPVCEDEPFRDQPAPAVCSGFLVGPDLVATAGHCIVGSGECANTAFVFGFVMLDPETAVLTVDASQVYFCDRIISQQISDANWGLIRLDRPVPDHTPLEVRTSGIVADSQQVVVVGYPLGVPRKYSTGANTTVRDNTPLDYFQANTDVNLGSSGAPVLATSSLVVEGILVRGNPDFVGDGACDRSLVCPDTGCPQWDDCTRTTAFADFLPTFDVYLGTDPASLEIVAPRHMKTWLDVGPLEPETSYFWRVDARDECGVTEGTVWTFSTILPGGAQIPGDSDQSGRVALTDAVHILNFLFLGTVKSLPCSDEGTTTDATYLLLDWDGDSDFVMTDAIALLQYLFLGGPPHVLGQECTPIVGCPTVCSQ